jgi:hypothetical protein
MNKDESRKKSEKKKVYRQRHINKYYPSTVADHHVAEERGCVLRC